MDPRSGFSSSTKTFYSLRPNTRLQPPHLPLSIPHYVFSILRSHERFSPSAPLVIDSSTDVALSYSDFLHRVNSLSFSLSQSYSLSPSSSGRRHVALILSPSSLHIPVLYFSLLSLNVVVSPANPLSTRSELIHLINLSDPTFIFATSSVSDKLTPFKNRHIVFLDSPEFESMLTLRVPSDSVPRVAVSQSDVAAILYSSGTTGRVKGVELTNRNFIALISGFASRFDDGESKNPPVSLITLPLFHVFGFSMLLRVVSLAETVVLMERFDFVKMLAAIEKYRITYMPVSPPLVVALEKSELANKYDLSSLEVLACGGAPLSKEVAERFRLRFPHVDILQGYGLTETVGGVASTISPEEYGQYSSVGRLSQNMEAKIVDLSTGEGLPPGQRGELWLRGPSIMKGYVGDKEATAATFHPDGWLKTGDLCYFDSKGLLYIVDRLKELIKYKGYQVPPAELEHVVLSHPEIADAAVIPYPDDEAGQIPMAFVVRKSGSSITESEVMDFVAKQVSPYKRIRRVSFVSSIPKNPSGKILRRELVNQAISSPLKL